MEYKKVVGQIVELPWDALESSDLQKLMVLSAYAAREFAESLRIALRLYLDNDALKEMAAGELDTNNLSFGDYHQKGDHADFLWHFIETYSLLNKIPNQVQENGETYVQKVQALSDEVRAMSVFSREEELPHIFENIIQAPDWSEEGLPEFQYYLKRHIELDTEDGGHADLVSSMQVTDDIKEFYEYRLNMYRCIDKLFV